MGCSLLCDSIKACQRKYSEMRRLRIAPIIRCITQPTIKKMFAILVFFCLLSIWMLAFHIASPRSNNGVKTNTRKQQQKTLDITREKVSGKSLQEPAQVTGKQQAVKVALVFLENVASGLAENITTALEANRIKYRTVIGSGDIPHLAYKGLRLYSVIIFENLLSYVNLSPTQRDMIDQYCRLYGIGIIAFAPPKDNDISYSSQIGNFPLYIDQDLSLKDLSLNPASNVYHITKRESTIKGSLPGDDWTVFRTNHTTYQPITRAKTGSHDIVHLGRSMVPILHPTVIHDLGTFDGIQRIFFGNDFKLWLHYILFLDSMHYLSDGHLGQELDRYILIDVDDIFVGSEGIRMKPEDVEAMVIEQENLREMVSGFQFNLGFSGNFFLRGTAEENLGDQAIIKAAHKFWWFPHMWDHSQPHIYTNETILKRNMLKNKNFAKEHNIPVEQGYAISPHHSGVYPVYDTLYTLWRDVWNVSVTSTEEYPHLKPARRRKGFHHNGIEVLPRQTCGLFTHTIHMAKYPGGRRRLDTSIMGGELFQTVINNPVNIFMTHLSNYGNDRLALYTFDKLINFMRTWTNLKFQTLPPRQLANKYFELFPEEKEPLWGNPCEDKKLTSIWSNAADKCSKYPRFLVIGPQKTGTTALYTFLSMHPHISHNLPSPVNFEELQFFNGKNYYKSLDWYLSFFPTPKINSSDVLFEKSAGYFDSSLAPARVHALLPKVKLISILLEPAQRAYSWYKHMQAHNNPTSLSYSFYEVISANSGSPTAVKDLKRRCLEPGKYAKHLERWLKYFSPHQMHLVDGSQLREDPITVMAKVLRFLHIKPYIDYSELLKYDDKKGFYCQVLPSGHINCLGKSKGHQYEPMDVRSTEFLSEYYRQHNEDLESLLLRTGQPQPQWLKDTAIER